MDKSLVDITTQLIGSLGFPIFVSIWMLFKDATDKKELTKALTNLDATMQKVCDRIDVIK